MGGVGEGRAAPAARRLRVAAVLVVVALAAAGALAYRSAIGPRPLERLAGPVGLPATVHDVPPGTPDVRDRPIEAASVILGDHFDDRYGLVSADGRAYRTLGVQAPDRGGLALSPDGRSIAWLPASRPGQEPDREVRVLRLADASEVALTVPGTRVDGVHWYPDNRRLLLAGTTAAGRAAWVADASGGTPREVCRCDGVALLSTTGAVVTVPPRAMPTATDVVPGPDGRSWAYADCCTTGGTLVLGSAAGVRPVEVRPRSGYQPDYVVAWTADGVWAGRRGGVDLVDPAGGQSRPVLETERGATLRSIATGLAAGARTVPAAEPPSTWYRPATLRAFGRMLLTLPEFFLVWLPAALFGRVGGVVVPALLAGLLAVWLSRRNYRTRRMRAMQKAPTAASTKDTTNNAR